jgi:tetratricopeptide (TPR) repeat protein
MLHGSSRSAAHPTLELAMQMALGHLLIMHEGFGSSAAARAFEAARELCVETGNLSQLFHAQKLLRVVYGNRGDYGAAFALGESNLRLATQLEDHELLAQAHGGLGLLNCFVGNFALSKYHLDQACHYANAAHTNASEVNRFANSSLYMLALWQLGYPQAAQRHGDNLVEFYERVEGPYVRAIWYEHCAILCHWQRDFRQMQHYGRKLVTLAEQYDFTALKQIGALHAAAASTLLGEEDGTLVPPNQNVAAFKAAEIMMLMPYYLSLLAEVYSHNGDFAQAHAALDEALTLAHEMSEHWWTAESHRLRGDLFANRGGLHEAESDYQRAIEVARSQGAKSLELRAALSLSRLWQAQNKRQGAATLLTPIYAWFSEGFETPDLKEAAALLASLRA